MIYLLWFVFLIILGLIFISGEKVSVLGEKLALRIGITEGLIGVTLISAITSFPELFTGISAVSIVRDHNMMFGEILGSCIFNLTIVSLMSLIFGKVNLFKVISERFRITSFLSGILFLVVAFFLKIRLPSIFFVGIPSLIIIALYFIILKIIYDKEFKPKHEEEKTDDNLKSIIIKFSFFSLIIIGTGLYLPILAKKIAVEMSWSSTFMGMLFIAIVTSMPELIVSFAAAKRGLYGIAVGNIFGSIIFNILIIAIIDFTYIKGTIWQVESWANFWTSIVVAVISFIAVLSGRFAKNRFINILLSLIIVAAYIAVLFLSFNI
jgi:cation:H+ antiporter